MLDAAAATFVALMSKLAPNRGKDALVMMSTGLSFAVSTFILLIAWISFWNLTSWSHYRVSLETEGLRFRGVELSPVRKHLSCCWRSLLICLSDYGGWRVHLTSCLDDMLKIAGYFKAKSKFVAWQTNRYKLIVACVLSSRLHRNTSPTNQRLSFR